MFKRWPWRRPAKSSAATPSTHNEDPSAAMAYDPSPEDFPVFPPPSPSVVLQDVQSFCTALQARKYGAPRGIFEDSPLYALFRFYEFILVDEVIPYRNTLEAFWRKRDWAVQDIPDPEDKDPQRYAVLAACTYLIVRAFNARVKLGLARHMPSILLPEEVEELRNTPHHLRRHEKVPTWAEQVAPLESVLSIPTHDGVVLDGKEDERADSDFLTKNILIWTPHIHFT